MINSKILPIHNRYAIDFARGNGAYLFDKNGKEYIDFHGGVAVNILGHNDTDIKNAIIEQIDTGITHLSNTFFHQKIVDLAERLCKLTFADSVYFLNSGTEVVEMAIKTCRKYYHDIRKKKNIGSNFFLNDREIPHIISLKNSFHGRTMGSIALQNKYTEGFEPTLKGFSQAEINNIDSIKKQIYSNTTAIFIEPIQGEGGVIECNKEFLQEVRKICDENDILLVIDEIQTGIGRTGYLYVYQYFDVIPNLLLTAKGLGSGVPIGAVLFDKNTASVMTVGSHGSTFGGNILSAAVSIAVLDKINKPENLKYISDIGLYLKNKLREKIGNLSAVKDIRGMGLMVGVEMIKLFDMDRLKLSLFDSGLLIMVSGNVVRILPSMCITKEDVDRASSILYNVIKQQS
jgi:acetylornithine/N-succinyldiaminopimelate aminotransferase